MRLLNVENLNFHEFFGDAIPRYAILSHTWGLEEVTFRDLSTNSFVEKHGSRKLYHCSKQTARDGLQYLWMDTCCIDKSRSSELSEAVNSMFRWYRDASVCYVYLEDVSKNDSWITDFSISGSPLPAHQRVYEADESKLTRPVSEGVNEAWESDFRKSRWFTRGWTLQELIAPASVVFYSREWQRLGNKASLQRQIHEITGIGAPALHGVPLTHYSVAERMSWAAKRETTLEEDAAYSLLGIFDVHMPVLYGEGRQKAFLRLMKEISKSVSYQLQQVGTKANAPELDRKGRSPLEPQVQRGPKPSIEINNISSDTSWSPYPSTRLADSRFRTLILEPGVIGDKLVGNIQELDISDPQPYYALSYPWGQEPDLHPIWINEHQKLIRSNLFHALQRIRQRSGPVRLWVDNICINQKDDLERNSQVRQMAKIYQNAEGVFIWLGEEDSTSKLAMEFIDEIIKPKFQWNGSWWEEYRFKALAQILDRPWFRRRWVLQEAALSNNSTIYCGDQQVFMKNFAMAVNLVRARLNITTGSLVNSDQTLQLEALSNFRDSPAIKLLDTIDGAFRRSEDGSILHRRLTLENLVDLGRFSETTDDRDIIYALLSLARDAAVLPESPLSEAIVPDYSKPVLDVYADFVLHCIRHSGSLDILCRPWAPKLSSKSYDAPGIKLDNSKLRKLPSWIATRDKLPSGDPSLRLTHRLNGKPFVGTSQKPVYRCHYNTKPHAWVEERKDAGECDRSLFAKGIVLGEIEKRSTRMASAIITKECLETLGTITYNPCSNIVNIPDAMWRTLCADRDDKGDPAQPVYPSAMLHLLQLSAEVPDTGPSTNLLEYLSSIDVEELLEAELPDHVRKFLEITRDVIWNRRAFRTKPVSGIDGSERPLVGLIPPSARLGDRVCILYGCSVPVVLRKSTDFTGADYWQLIGDAYVDGIMDGEAIQFASASSLSGAELFFEIR